MSSFSTLFFYFEPAVSEYILGEKVQPDGLFMQIKYT